MEIEENLVIKMILIAVCMIGWGIMICLCISNLKEQKSLVTEIQTSTIERLSEAAEKYDQDQRDLQTAVEEGYTFYLDGDDVSEKIEKMYIFQYNCSVDVAKRVVYMTRK